MDTHARVVVIGGGITGCAILYHLAKKGWKDVVLLERSELTSGSTWHAAGNLFSLTRPSNAQRLQVYTINLYPEIERESGQAVGYHPTGGMHLAASNDEVTTLAIARARARRNGVEAEWITFEEAKDRAPVLDTKNLKAVLWEPIKGHVDPSSATNAFAAAARKLGAKIHRHTPVTATTPRADGGWDVETPGGTIHAEFVVNAAGLWAPALATLIEGLAAPHVPTPRYAKGNYFSLAGRAPFSHLIYPVPEEAGLGVHLTLDLAGQARFGPDVEWITPDSADAIDYRVDPERAAGFEVAIRRYWPGLRAGALQPAYSGVRPKLQAPGEAAHDFVLQGPAEHGARGLANLYGIETPGRTASLALADEVVSRLTA